MTERLQDLATHLDNSPNQPAFATMNTTGAFPGPKCHIRIARPSRNLEKAQYFYVNGLGMKVLYRLKPADTTHKAGEHVDDLVMLGWPGASWHLELVLDHTVETTKVCLPQPTEEDLLVVYVDGPIDCAAVDKLVDAGGRRVEAKNPYWEQWGVTVEDPDGYRLVLSQRGWVNE